MSDKETALLEKIDELTAITEETRSLLMEFLLAYGRNDGKEVQNIRDRIEDYFIRRKK
jgi:hypothetical protein